MSLDYVRPVGVITEALEAAENKQRLPVRDMLLRGFLSGAFLGFATSLAMAIRAQGLPPIVGAAVFPVGFVILVLLGLELVTGNFALLPMGVIAGQGRLTGLLRSWGWVYAGNLMGGVFYAAMFYAVVTSFGATDGGSMGEQLRQLAEKKTLAYKAIGYSGWGTALVSGSLCNWMVTVGTILAFVSRSTVGKIAAMWLPVMTFFALGYEHSVVNMYVIPSAMLLGAPVSMADWWLWNQIPVTIGNIIGGALFTGLALYVTYAREVKKARAAGEMFAGDEGEDRETTGDARVQGRS